MTNDEAYEFVKKILIIRDNDGYDYKVKGIVLRELENGEKVILLQIREREETNVL